ncbi:hypothetical protein [Nostoc sp. 'Peltigera membranacea cyanobiont' 232]|uniref:hypothetical protein n=1 Tax=Nostoc sp. 'Peltigera membranacea cyanobiont' 232 TaxID=2014531 RepID=UPI001672EB50|nr:hypothetical protein [Nostoc sp. 'Peltigera membranacea cyanobiont' 232]
MTNIQIKERKVVELHPHPKNDSIYGDEDIEQLAQDIKRSKWIKPLIGVNIAKLSPGAR